MIWTLENLSAPDAPIDSPARAAFRVYRVNEVCPDPWQQLSHGSRHLWSKIALSVLTFAQPASGKVAEGMVRLKLIFDHTDLVGRGALQQTTERICSVQCFGDGLSLTPETIVINVDVPLPAPPPTVEGTVEP
jgi:hypothetical protein